MHPKVSDVRPKASDAHQKASDENCKGMKQNSVGHFQSRLLKVYCLFFASIKVTFDKIRVFLWRNEINNVSLRQISKTALL